MGRAAALIVALGIALSGAPAAAQLPDPPAEPSETDMQRARDAFVHAMELAGEERWIDALEEFLRSYELSGSPVALYNIGSALRALERFSEAREAFDRLLEQDDLDEETRHAAREYRNEVAARIAIVTIADVPRGDARVVADEHVREGGRARPIELSFDPGDHTIAIELAGHDPWRWSGTVAAGARVPLRAAFVPIETHGSIFTEPLFWVIAAGALVAGAVVVGVVVDASLQLSPRTGAVIVLP